MQPAHQKANPAGISLVISSAPQILCRAVGNLTDNGLLRRGMGGREQEQNKSRYKIGQEVKYFLA